MIGVQTELQVAANTGAKKIECVKCLWNSIDKSGSEFDLIKISISGVIPPVIPQIVATLISFFLEVVCALNAPNKLWDKGSIF